jgi:hypothetical protein
VIDPLMKRHHVMLNKR